ncbi:hypothetical protein KIPB_010617 [Kipferlia bialata]|uniref:Rab-GAP TBC domain-containing protein n=1 Tax=Kipferlia bialata TaxID=797122 RepID=A0A9K3GMN9_9EUKA|nr:hypothetical protein KIPB_010617 [Kipferlia bialata]|eukprot:g10617.t1
MNMYMYSDTDGRDALTTAFGVWLSDFFHRYPTLRYYQGFNDLAAIPFLLYGAPTPSLSPESYETALGLLSTIAFTKVRHYLEECFRSAVKLTTVTVDLLEAFAPDLSVALKTAGVEPGTFVPPAISWHIHGLDTKEPCFRLADFYVSTPAVSPFYTTAVFLALDRDAIMSQGVGLDELYCAVNTVWRRVDTWDTAAVLDTLSTVLRVSAYLLREVSPCDVFEDARWLLARYPSTSHPQDGTSQGLTQSNRWLPFLPKMRQLMSMLDSEREALRLGRESVLRRRQAKAEACAGDTDPDPAAQEAERELHRPVKVRKRVVVCPEPPATPSKAPSAAKRRLRAATKAIMFMRTIKGEGEKAGAGR